MYSRKKTGILVASGILLLTLCFFLGRLSVSNTQTQDIQILSSTAIRANRISEEKPVIQIRASSRGKKYYFPWCQSTFSEDNTIYFKNEEEAISAGYELASNCLRTNK